MTSHARCYLFVAVVASLAACAEPKHTDSSYYDARIAPILEGGCQRQTTGCHVDDGRGFALGNLDLGSYERLEHRSDVLVPYGPYPVGLLLLKGGEPVDIDVETVDPPDPAHPERRFVRVRTDVRHGGGEGAIAQGSADYAALKQWIEGGYSADGVKRTFESFDFGECSHEVVAIPGVDLSREPDDAESFDRFANEVQPILRQRCASSSCHGASAAGLHLTCGDDDEQLRSNYEAAIRYVSEVAVSSELLRRPLAIANGGVFHEGGDVFESADDSDYATLRAWTEDLVERRPELTRFAPEDEGLRFFANRVQPVLVRKGCMFLGCHSPAMFHDLRLRSGAGGDFSELSTRRNHEMSRALLALESTDPNASRFIAKNLCPPESGGRGVKHRGGPLLEDFGGCAADDTRAQLARCENVDADSGDLNEVPAYCVLARWQAIERELAVARGEVREEPGPSAAVFVLRPAGVGGPTEHDVFRPGADLMVSDATRDVDGTLSLGTARSLLDACGFGSDVDVRAPAVSWDGTRIAFAARDAADEPLRLYEVAPSGEGCAPLAALAPASDRENGILTHDFDPAYAPDGRIVFASTRGYLSGALRGTGPTRTPARMEPNANLFVYEPDASTKVRQLTFLLDQELSPSFMADGRVIFTAEKRALDFHQLAGRRQNLDGGDYHPLFAQRPSIGFDSATEIVELANRNLALVASTLDARDGGGSIAIVNRSIGPDQDDRDPGDRAYIHSLTTPTPGVLGGESGVFRSPAPLPDGDLLASCDLQASSLDGAAPSYALCQLDTSGHLAPRVLYRDATRVVVDAVAVYGRGNFGVFGSRLDEVNGSTRIDPDGGDVAHVHYLDVPMLSTLLFANTRTARIFDDRVGGARFFQAAPPPSGVTDFDDVSEQLVEDRFGVYFESLTSLGSAPLARDGSLRVRLPAGAPLSLALTTRSGSVLRFPDDAPFEGDMRQREAVQLYPGEQAQQSLPRQFFDGLCGGCHGSVSGRELDVGVRVDVLTSASRTAAGDEVDLAAP